MREVSDAMKAGDPSPLLEKLEKQSGETAQPIGGDGVGIEAIMNIPVNVQVVLGSTTIPVSRLMSLSRGSILPLDHKVGEPVEVVVNGRVVARGELVIMDDESSRFGVALTEVVSSPPIDG